VFLIQLLYRQLPNAADRDTYERVKNSPPTAEANPYAFAWFHLVSKFTDDVRNTWGGSVKQEQAKVDKK
jgi:hypothetical protein